MEGKHASENSGKLFWNKSAELELWETGAAK